MYMHIYIYVCIQTYIKKRKRKAIRHRQALQQPEARVIRQDYIACFGKWTHGSPVLLMIETLHHLTYTCIYIYIHNMYVCIRVYIHIRICMAVSINWGSLLWVSL